MKKAGTTLVLLMAAACGNKRAVQPAPPTTVSLPKPNHTTSVAKNDTSGVTVMDMTTVQDSILDEKIYDRLHSLVEIRDMIRDTMHRREKYGKRFSYITHNPDSTEPDYVIQAGYDDTIHFETWYWIHITPKTFKIRFYDTVSDSLYDVNTYRAFRKRNDQ